MKKQNPDDDIVVVNCNDGYWPTSPVGSFKPNPFGLFDILGNVTEWVEDCYVENYNETPRDGGPNLSGPCSSHVIRGGAWDTGPRGIRAARRGLSGSSYIAQYLGFRVARTTTP
jgi:formylglycine-generating enzyme required for sulfatase activity